MPQMEASSATVAVDPSLPSTSDVQCVLDRSLINADTLSQMKDVGLSIFASACSKNRGAFVLTPSDGHTYGCLAFPANIKQLAGMDDSARRVLEEDVDTDDTIADEYTNSTISTSNTTNTTNTTNATAPQVHVPVKINDANAIVKQFAGGNLTASDAVDLLDFLVQNVYLSTPFANQLPYGCDVTGLVTLECDAQRKQQATTPIRAVTMAGMFAPALWATQGEILTLAKAQAFYSDKDFTEMKALGLNAVQIPVSVNMFVDQKGKKASDLLTDTLDSIRNAHLQALIVLESASDASGNRAVAEAAKFCKDYNALHPDAILSVTLPSKEWAVIEAAVSEAPGLKLWLPTAGGDLPTLHAAAAPSSQIVGAAIDMSHTDTVADVASSTSPEDRAKLFYHETMACLARAPLEYTACYQSLPTFVMTGFDLAIDDCHLNFKNASSSKHQFHDFGQCDRFHETLDSPWWEAHRQSFAARQLFAYERGLGWSFAAWKLYGSKKKGIIDKHAKLLSFRDVALAGLMPSLFDLDKTPDYSANATLQLSLACLNPPANDFILGDETLAPTPAPLPNCGNGWWNVSTSKCDYWVAPTIPPCPVCSSNSSSSMLSVPLVGCPDAGLVSSPGTSWYGGTHGLLAAAFVAGAVLAFLTMSAVMACRRSNHNKRSDYEPVPNNPRV